MLSIFTIYVIHHVALAIGLACSLVIDLFIIVVQKMKRIRSIEKKIVNRVLSFSFISAFIVFSIEISHLFLLLLTDTGTVYTKEVYTFNAITTLISSVLLFTVATQKYYQIKILYRYQEQHHHLSDSFVKHHKELGFTSVLSLILWIALYICYVVNS